MEAAAAAGGHALLLSAVGCLYVAWRHPVLDYAKEFTVNVPMMGAQPVHLNATRTLFVKYEDAEPVVPSLVEKHSYVAASMVVLFGAVLPVLKVLLTLRTDAKSAGWARLLARWTLVDALAEALVVGLLLAADVTAELRVGFVAFLGYVVLSHAALALLRAPDAPQAQRSAPRALVFGLAFAFFVLFWLGVRQIALRLWMTDSSLLSQLEERINANPASKMLGMLGQTVEGLAKDLAKQIPPVRGEVSLVSALSLLARGDATSRVGSAALLVLTLVLPVLDVALSLVAVTAERLPQMGTAPLRALRPLVHELASLDVLVVGVCICCAVTENVQNLSAAPAPGLAMLGAAAVCQVALHHVTQALPLAKGKEGKDLV